jgi:predicted RNA-binding protein with PUA-like domain
LNYWLLKTEPDAFSIDALARLPRQTTCWDGVRNYQARNSLRDSLKVGDEVFIYHSSCEIPAITGIARVVRAGYPDHTAFDRKHIHFDEGSDRSKPRWYMVDIQLQRPLKRVITLEELRTHAARELQKLVLLQKGSRLSVQPVGRDEWRFILSLE